MTSQDVADSSVCGSMSVQLDVTSDFWALDSDYPADYITQRNNWLSDPNIYNALDAPPVETDIKTFGDASLMCRTDSNLFLQVNPASAAQSFIQGHIADACKLFDGIHMDPTNQTNLVMVYPQDTGSTVYLGAE
jgi:hypothetical protein